MQKQQLPCSMQLTGSTGNCSCNCTWADGAAKVARVHRKRSCGQSCGLHMDVLDAWQACPYDLDDLEDMSEPGGPGSRQSSPELELNTL